MGPTNGPNPMVLMYACVSKGLHRRERQRRTVESASTMDMGVLKVHYDKRPQCVPPPLSNHKTRGFFDARDVDRGLLVQRVRSPLTWHEIRLYRDLVWEFERGGRNTICGGSSERDHIFWEDLGHSTNASRYNMQASTCGF